MFINQHDQQNTFLECIKLFLTWSTNSEPNYLAEKSHCVTFLLRNSRTRDAAITSVYEGSIFASQTFNSWRRQQAPAMSMWFLFLNHKLVGARHIETFQSSNTTLARFSDPRRCPSYSLPYQFPSKCDSDSQMRWWGGRRGYNLGDGHFQHIYRKKKKSIKISTLLKGDDSDADALRYMSIFFFKTGIAAYKLCSFWHPKERKMFI